MSHECITFQGLSIKIENPKGSVRTWYDPHTDTTGSTKMLRPYGFFTGTLGLDGDEVDVYVGDEEDAPKVYIVTQLKAPEFRHVDEQKVMLGFKSEEAAKQAYLKQYDDPRFFSHITSMSLDSFRRKLNSQRGGLIKALYELTNSAIMGTIHKSGDNHMEDKKNCEHGEDCTKCHSAPDMLKSLADKMFALAKSSAPKAVEVETPDLGYVVKSWDFNPDEGKVAKSTRIPTPLSEPIKTPTMYKSCVGCGRVNKSFVECPRCTKAGQ
jgi:hypothetical protein